MPPRRRGRGSNRGRVSVTLQMEVGGMEAVHKEEVGLILEIYQLI